MVFDSVPVINMKQRFINKRLSKTTTNYYYLTRYSDLGARRSSVVGSAHGAMDRQIDLSWTP